MISIVIGTYNRLEQIKSCISSIQEQTKSPYKIYIADAGSTDGTVEHLKSIASENVIPVFHGRKRGQANAYNDVFFNYIDTPYVCWMSDDNVLVKDGLDIALDIAHADPGIGMVALKVRDLEGPFMDAPYIGGISPIGILNVNQGLLPMEVLREVGGFSEVFSDYGIDPDLSAKVLFAGYKIVYTKDVVIHHYRGWPSVDDMVAFKRHQEKLDRSMELYQEHYGKAVDHCGFCQIKNRLCRYLFPIVTRLYSASSARTFKNIMKCRYVSIFDSWLTREKKYHLVQRHSKASRLSKFVYRFLKLTKSACEKIIFPLHMNDHAFANGRVYPSSIGSPLTALILGAFDNLHLRGKMYLVWRLFRSQAVIENDVLLGANARITNKTGNARAVTIGKGSICRGIIRVEGDGEVHIGRKVYLGDNVVISARDKITIGDGALIAHGAQIFDNTTHPLSANMRIEHCDSILNREPEDYFNIPHAPLHLGKRCWIGMNAIILKGAAVGDRAIVGAGTVVTKPVPDDSMVVNSENRLLRLRPNNDDELANPDRQR